MSGDRYDNSEPGIPAATAALRLYGEWHGDLKEDVETVAQDLVTDVLNVIEGRGGDCQRLIRCAVMNYEGERDEDAFA